MARQRRMQDHFAARAKREGKAARSVFKLEEIDRRWKLLKPGMRVLDLGCAPGSWLQYVAKQVGGRGKVIGYDLTPVKVSLPAHVEARVGDVFALDSDALQAKFDLVLSDMAPATMGDHKTDAIRSAGLAEAALGLAGQHLRPGGSVVVKVLEGGDVPNIVKAMRTVYQKVERLRPKATRRESTEIYLIGLRLKAANSKPDAGSSGEGAR